jgi:hypothetical protein
MGSHPLDEEFRAVGFTPQALMFPRDDLACRLLAAFNNVPVDILPAGARYFPNEATKAAWRRVADAFLDEVASRGLAVVPRSPTRRQLDAAASALTEKNRPKPDYLTNKEKNAHRYKRMVEAYAGPFEPDADLAPITP